MLHLQHCSEPDDFTWITPWITTTSSPFEDNEGHKANHHSCQDGAVDGDEFVVEAIVDWLLGITVGGRGSRGSCCGTICGDFLWKNVIKGWYREGCERL